MIHLHTKIVCHFLPSHTADVNDAKSIGNSTYLALLALSRTTKPKLHIRNKKLLASPSIMYCPLTLYAKKATGLGLPRSSVTWKILQ